MHPPSAGLPLNPVFAGRADPVQELRAHLAAGRLAVVTGLPGVGKTELVRQVANQLAGRYQALVIDMLGWHRDRQVRRDEAYRPLLHGLGVTPVPPTVDAQAAVYHRMLAELGARGRPVLLVFDNVADPQELAGLLPPAPHRALVTSRGTLDLDCPTIELTPLDERHAVALADGMLRLSRPDDDRLTRDPRAAERLATLCGGLPLALVVAAALLRRRPDRSAADLVADLDDVRTRLSHLKDGHRDVQAAVELSLVRVPTAAAELFTLLALDPGVDCSAAAAAALAGCEAAEAERRLQALHGHHLITVTDGRWRMHDMIRCHATNLAADLPGTVRHRAVDRLLDHYAEQAQAYATRAGWFLLRHTRPGPRSPVVPLWPARAEALRWFAAERRNLLACVSLAFTPVTARPWWLRRAATRARYRRGLRLVDAFAGHLRNDGPWEEAEHLHRQAADIAGRLRDRLARGIALNDLGIIRRLRCDDEAALAAVAAARAEFRGSSRAALLGRANADNETGIVLTRQGRAAEAVTVLERARAGYRRAADPIGTANAAKNLGVALHSRDAALAVRWLAEATAGYSAIGDRLGLAEAANHLGRLSLSARDRAGARSRFLVAGAEAELAASRWEFARAADGMGDCTVNDPVVAAQWWLRAAQAYAAIGADRDEARVRGKIADAAALVEGSPQWDDPHDVHLPLGDYSPPIS